MIGQIIPCEVNIILHWQTENVVMEITLKEFTTELLITKVVCHEFGIVPENKFRIFICFQQNFSFEEYFYTFKHFEQGYQRP